MQLAIFGALFVGFGLIGEYRDGVIEAERVTPASRTALLLGRVLRDVLQVSVQSAILIALGFAFGMRASVGGMLLGFILALFLTGAIAAGGYALALTVKTEDALAAVANGVSLPVLLLSGILLPMSLAPLWLQRVSDFIPVKHIVTGIRDLFAGGGLGTPVCSGRSSGRRCSWSPVSGSARVPFAAKTPSFSSTRSGVFADPAEREGAEQQTDDEPHRHDDGHPGRGSSPRSAPAWRRIPAGTPHACPAPSTSAGRCSRRSAATPAAC